MLLIIKKSFRTYYESVQPSWYLINSVEATPQLHILNYFSPAKKKKKINVKSIKLPVNVSKYKAQHLVCLIYYSHVSLTFKNEGVLLIMTSKSLINSPVGRFSIYCFCVKFFSKSP